MNGKHIWLGILQDAAADLNAIIDEIASGEIVFENIEQSARNELEWLSHRVMDLRDQIVADHAQASFCVDPYAEFRHIQKELL